MNLLVLCIGLWTSYPRPVHGFGPNCLSCEAVASSEQCLHIVRCEEKQVCDTITTLSQQSAIGKRAGTNFLQCSECCSDNFCNQRTCISTNPSLYTPASGFINCVDCQQVADPVRDCHSVRPCPPDHSCYVKRVVLHGHTGHFRWDMGCWDEQQIQAFNKTAVQDGCFKTCKTSFCNMHGCNDSMNYVTVR